MSTSKNNPFAGEGFEGGFGAGGGFAAGMGDTRPLDNPHEDPFKDLGEPTGDLEKDSNDEVEALSDAFKGFRQRMSQEQKRFKNAVDAGFWAGICFKSSEDLMKFLDTISPVNLYRSTHIDGYELAEKMGLEIDWEDK
ncbi:hypothetical protein [Corynebacterium accolens]|uniref:hypothetical protein n=1 Tax=Corynebacterium accolens TaxID=38284 RepID=UPI002542960B|nr:hypothetical protein [Corynebacterium accolens]MDK4338305.1 hypothetical protein [Corynebacterium accolens]